MGCLDACFAELLDARTGKATRHDLIEVATIALVASVAPGLTPVRARNAMGRVWQRSSTGGPTGQSCSTPSRPCTPPSRCRIVNGG